MILLKKLCECKRSYNSMEKTKKLWFNTNSSTNSKKNKSSKQHAKNYFSIQHLAATTFNRNIPTIKLIKYQQKLI